MDRATESLENITASGEYVCVPNVVCFDEHDEFDRTGKLVRRFDRNKLQKIVDKCNAREQATGDLAVIAPGHSRDDITNEEHQPPIWGYAANYRVGTFGPQQKLGILCDYYVQKKITTAKGDVVDGPTYIRSFPRRSIELWPDSPSIPEHARNTIDWHALLRRSPQRDLGLMAYSMTPTGKLRYQMEAAMPDPVEEPREDVDADLDADDDAGEEDAGMEMPEGHEEFAKHLDYAMANHPCLKHMSDQHAKMMAGDGGEPASKDEDEKMRMERSGVQKTKYQRELDEKEQRLSMLEAELAIEKQAQRIKRYEMSLEALSDEYEIDVPTELADVAELDEESFEKHVNRIKRSYSRTPVGGDLPLEYFEEPAGAADLNDPKVGAKIHRYMTDNPEFCQKYGEKSFIEAAKVLKIIG